MTNYAEFLNRKKIVAPSAGFEPSGPISPVLFDFQSAITSWALRRGRAAVFLDTGLGKSLIQLEWARHVVEHTGKPVLIVAPLSVAEQTAREAEKLGLIPPVIRHPEQLQPGINLTNYEMLAGFAGADLGGIILDESSRLKAESSKTRKLAIEKFTYIPYRLCCTATPCPNDVAELTNHAEFLGVMTRREVLAAFFVHDQDGWRMRGHAREPFYRWLASWAMSMKSPSDLGFDGTRFVLPSLDIKNVTVESQWRKPGELFAGAPLKGIVDRSSVRRATVDARVLKAAEIAARTDGQLIVWCGLNDESGEVSDLLTDAVELRGDQDIDEKRRILLDFISGKIRILVTKVKIAGFGMNFQNASTMIFLGLNDSWESYYQAIRRCWRYGQKHPVTVHVVVSDHETGIVENIRRKESEAEALSLGIVEATRAYEIEELKQQEVAEMIESREFEGEGWKLYQGDCVEEMSRLGEDSIDLSVFSPPFMSLFTYSATERDIGNNKSPEEFFEHFGFVIDGLLRVTKPGRLAAVHVSQTATTLVTHGVIGLNDLRGKTIDEFCRRGWIYQGECCIDKDPQAQAIRTHAKGLLFVQLRKDASWLRPGLADFILVFRKPGENVVPIHPDISNDDWIEWARPIWYGIKESETLNSHEARSNDDDRHVCPLQLGTIERCIRLWSNEGETIFSPFAGIGSEGYVALKWGRKFIGCELKSLYAEVAAKNLNRALGEINQGRLFA